MGYAKQFDFIKFVVPAFLQTIEWQDVSWGNDACPRFENEDLCIAVWVAEHEPEDREIDDMKEYTVCRLILHKNDCPTLEDDDLFSTDSINKLLEWIELEKSIQTIEHCITVFNNMTTPIEECQDSLVTCLTRLQEMQKELN